MSDLWVPRGSDLRAQVQREVRDPRGATQGVSFQGLGGRGSYAVDTSTRTFQTTYISSWLVNRAINILADTCSQLPFRAGPDLEKPAEFSQNAPLARLLGPPPEGPNPEMSARKLWKLAILNYLITGRFAWEIESVGGQVVGLWHLVSSSLSAVPESGGRAYFSGFLYEVGQGQPIPFTREQVVYGWNPSPDNPRAAESVLRSLQLNASILLQLDRYQYAFVANDAKPATVVIHGPMADRDAKEAFQRKFMGDYRGPDNANKTAFLEVDPDDTGDVSGMIDIKPIGSTAKDSQFVQIYEQQLRAVSGGTGVPMSLLDASGRTFDNAGQEAYNYYDVTVMPLLADLQDHINRDLAPKLGNEVGWFDISSVPALKPKLTVGMVFADVATDMTQNERRSFAGLGPGDPVALLAEKQAAIKLQRETFAATQPVAAAPGSAPSAPAEPTAAQKNGTQNDTIQQKDGGKVLAFKREEERHGGSEGHDPIHSGHAETALEGAIAVHRKASIGRIAALLGRQLQRFDAHSARSALTRAEGKRGRQMLADPASERVAAIYDRTFWVDEARAALAPVYEAAVGSAATALEGIIPVETDLSSWVDTRAQALADVLVSRRIADLDAGCNVDLLTQQAVVDAVASAHGERGDLDELSAAIFDESVRALTGISTDVVRDLLTKLTAGEIDLDRAMGELIQ